MHYRRMIMEVESPEQIGYEFVRYNLAESSMSDRTFGELELDLDDLILCYGDHRGHPELRAQIAADGRGNLAPEDVLVCVGAAGALFTVATTLLGPSDRLVVAHPNYASNLETPRAIGCEIAVLPMRFEDGFRIDLDRLQELVQTPTKLISLTSPHNPTGAVISLDELQEIARIAETAGAWLLIDDTYAELTDNVLSPASTLGPHVISVSSVSKTYGVPGIRVGWLSTTNAGLMEELLAAKEQIALSHSVVDEAIALDILKRRESLLPSIRRRVQTAREVTKRWIEAEPALEWVEPHGGVVCFPRISAESGVDPTLFYQVLNEEFATWVGPGHWFEQDPNYMRIGFGYPTPEDLPLALANVSGALREASAGGLKR